MALPLPSSSKNLLLAPSKANDKKKSTRSVLGAPSQLNQSSRKGKKAWRKHVDIGEVEAGMEEIRAEERVIGKPLQKTKDDELFVIDTKGDDQIRKNVRARFSASQLTSTKILAQRSAVPAVYSRNNSTTAVTSSTKRKLSNEEKNRLLRIAKRPRMGPLGTVLDPSEYASGTGTVELSEAVKASGTYDAWAPKTSSRPWPKKINAGAESGSDEDDVLPDGMETVYKKPIKPPNVDDIRKKIEVPAILDPHDGTSYNPPVDAHAQLIEKASIVEQKRLRQAAKHSDVKAQIDKAKALSEVAEEGAPGMTVDAVADEENEDVHEGGLEDLVGESVPAKLPKRKTKQDRAKAARRLLEQQKLAARLNNKKLLALVNTAKSLRKSTARAARAREAAAEERKRAKIEKLKAGLGGTRLGKYKVPEGEVSVQLGEDLSENLRTLKPEGNLFRDRFVSLQQRAFIEPRVPVLPKRKSKMVEYEKHAWKRFE